MNTEHDGLHLHIYLAEHCIPFDDFALEIGKTPEELKALTLARRIPSDIKELSGVALGVDLSEIFNDRFKRVWATFHPFASADLESFIQAN